MTERPPLVGESFADRESLVVSVTDLYTRILDFFRLLLTAIFNEI
jgi:hypothetical protein